jgi:L-fuculose-phosphate aldolase
LSIPWHVRKRLVEICHLAASKGYVTAYEGNVSARMPGGNILITPTRLNKAHVQTEDLVLIDAEGRKLQGNHLASSEYRMHTTIYSARSDVMAVVHAHPPCATAFAVAGREMCIDCMPETLVELRAIPLVPYATPGTEELADQLRSRLQIGEAFLLQQHGAVTVGDTLDAAYYRMEQLEQAARVLHYAEALGGAKSLDADSQAKLAKMRDGAQSSEGP